MLESMKERKLVEMVGFISWTTRPRLGNPIDKSDWSAPPRCEIPACEAGCRMIAVPRKELPSLSSGKLIAL
jgi:hypothetical protein